MPYSVRKMCRLPITAVLAVCALIAGCGKRSDAPHTGTAVFAAGSTEMSPPPAVTDPAAIPVSAYYTLTLRDGVLSVRDAAQREVYRLPPAVVLRLTDADSAVLERDGIVYASRSELIDFLFSLEEQTPAAD